MQATFFVFRKLLAWLAAWIGAGILWGLLIGHGPNWILGVALLGGWMVVLVRAISHIHRVRLVSDRHDAGVLANRHRPRIEVPFAADEAFDMVEAAIRELPHLESVEATRASLQVHARIKRVDPYPGRKGEAREAPPAARARRNLVHAVVTPRDGSATVSLVCEPDAGAWFDWFSVDYGSNLENAEAITRALAQRIAARRKSEEASARQTQTEKELTEAKLSLLNAQVEPHFLYNTLASAQLLTRSDPDRADRMLGNLVTYLRHSVPRTEGEASTLGIELERARAYLEIMKIRMGERLAVEIQVSDALKGIPMPPMMLQTLVENAVKHGLEPLPGGGTIWIGARESDGRLAITVADNGAGFNALSAGTGVGLRNVRERLRLAYGEAASFSITTNFPKGVSATITIPAQ